jgi:Archaeal phage integrase
VGLLIHSFSNNNNSYNINNHNNNHCNPSPTRLLPALAGLGGFSEYLKAQKKRNVRQILCHVQRYHNVLKTGDASVLVSLSSGALRRHAMEALTAYAKYSGLYEEWCQIRKRYSLHWTNGDESLQAMHRFFNGDNLETMLMKVKEMARILGGFLGQIVKLGLVTGLRCSELLESIRLINDKDSFSKYYNGQQMALLHYKFPQFIRTTKKAWVSFVTPEMLAPIHNLEKNPPTYSAIRHLCNRKGIACNLHLCRKIHGSWLCSHGCTAQEVDLLQGRVGPSVFTRYYLTPDSTLRTRVIDALHKLLKQIES